MEVRKGRGTREGRLLTTIASLSEAEEFYHRAPLIFQNFASA